MIRYFRHAVDHSSKAPLAYLGSLQRLFVEDEDSGIIEIEYEIGQEVVLLYTVGKLVRMFCIEQDRSVPAVLSDLKTRLVGEELDIRSVSLPMQAVRAVSHALEWYPPIDSVQYRIHSENDYFSELKAQEFSGLLRLTLPEMDGFQLWMAGAPVSSEMVFSTPRGFEETLPNPLPTPSDLWDPGQIQVYKPGLDTKAWQIVALRTAMLKLVSGVILDYRKLVGQSMVDALDYSLNSAMRISHWNIRLVGHALLDHHFFPDIPAEREAYRVLVDTMTNHISTVVGSSLSQRSLSGVFQNLRLEDQACLVSHSLDPGTLFGGKKYIRGEGL